MNRERNFGVTEAGLGLTLVTCVLLVVGYLVLHYLTGTREAPTVEIRPSTVAEPAAATPGIAPEQRDEQPRVLTVESTDLPGHALRTSPESELR